MHILSILVLIVGASTERNFRWENSIIPYFFEGTVSADDMDLIKSQMTLVEEKTCLQFSAEPQENAPRKHLRISVNQTQCNDADGKMRFKGRVDFPEDKKDKDEEDGEILFQSSFTLTDGECKNHGEKVRGGILGMLFSALGATHTHRRPDRDQYIQIKTDCIPEKYLKMFEIIDNPSSMAMSVPYACDSLMHYRNDSGSNCKDDSCGGFCPTIVAKPGNDDCDKIGSYEANAEDWLMLNRYHCARRMISDLLL